MADINHVYSIMTTGDHKSAQTDITGQPLTGFYSRPLLADMCA